MTDFTTDYFRDTDESQNDCEALGEHQDAHLIHDRDGYRTYDCWECGAEWWEGDEE